MNKLIKTEFVYSLVEHDTIIKPNKPNAICITEHKLDPSIEKGTLGLNYHNI